MIVEIKNGKIKEFEISNRNCVSEGEIFIPDNWGVNEVFSLFFDDVYNKKDYSIKENPDSFFSLFDISNKKINKNFQIQDNFDCEFYLFNVFLDKSIDYDCFFNKFKINENIEEPFFLLDINESWDN